MTNTSSFFVISLRSLMFTWVFLCLPLFDMLNGFLIVRGYLSEVGFLSPSKLGRVIASLILFCIVYKNKLNWKWLYFFFIGVVVESFLGIRFGDEFSVVFGYMTVYRLAYVWLLFTVLKFYAKNDILILGRFLKYNVVLISFSIIVAHFTGWGNSTYGSGFGTKGFFASGNGLGIYIGSAILILMCMRHYRIYTDFSVWLGLLGLLSVLLIGSKTALLLAVLIILFGVWFSKYRMIYILLLTAFIVLFLPNIIIIARVAFDVIIKRYQNSDSLIAFLTSERLYFVQDAFSSLTVQGFDLLRFLIGGGSYVSFQRPDELVKYDMLEMDIADMFFMYGALGLLFYLVFFIRGATIFKGTVFIMYVWLIIFSHSVLAGHVVLNGMNVTLLSYLLAVGYAIKVMRNNSEKKLCI
jgi:hypothetical protein